MKNPLLYSSKLSALSTSLLRLGTQLDGDDLDEIQSVKLRVHLS